MVLENISNCGLLSLSSLISIKTSSIRSIQNLAEDNGVKLYAYLLNSDEIQTINVPFIAHSPNHFTTIETKSDLIGLDLTGYIITAQKLNKIEITNANEIFGETNNDPIPLIDVVIEKDCPPDKNCPDDAFPTENKPPVSIQEEFGANFNGKRPKGFVIKSSTWNGDSNTPHPVINPKVSSYTLYDTGQCYKIEYDDNLFPTNIDVSSINLNFRRGKSSKITINQLDDNFNGLALLSKFLYHQSNLNTISVDNLYTKININSPDDDTTVFTILSASSSSATYSNTFLVGDTFYAYQNYLGDRDVYLKYNGETQSIVVNATFSDGSLSLMDFKGETINTIDVSNGIKQISITLSSAQILSIYSTPIEIIPAPGNGKFIEIMSASCKVDFNTTPYSANLLHLITDTATEPQFRNVKILTATGSVIWKFGEITANDAADTQIIENKGIYVTSVSSDPVDGDSSITIYVCYREVVI